MKLDEQLEINTNPSNTATTSLGQETTANENLSHDFSSQGISIENASYIENNLEVENKFDHISSQEEYTPKLFSEDNNTSAEKENSHNDKLFEQNFTDEEEFEIPAFLRKQKF